MSEHAHHGMHPEADLLSAFAEGALPEHERLACLDHLAACLECREVVYLMQAAAMDDAPPAAAPEEPKPIPFWKVWFAPVPAVSALAAVAVLVVSIAIYRHKAPPAPQPELMAKVEAPSPAAPPASPVEEPVRLKAARSKPVVRTPAPVAPPPPATGEAQPSVPVPPFLPGTFAVRAAPQATPAPPAGVTGAVTDAAQEARPSVRPTTRKGNLQPARIARADSVLKLGNVSESIAVQAGASSAELASASVQPPSASRGNIMLRVGSGGTLLRSTNSGKSWNAVKGRWQGKVVRLVTPPDAPDAADAVFQLNTDSGAVWFSRDGNGWTPAPAAH